MFCIIQLNQLGYKSGVNTNSSKNAKSSNKKSKHKRIANFLVTLFQIGSIALDSLFLFKEVDMEIKTVRSVLYLFEAIALIIGFCYKTKTCKERTLSGSFSFKLPPIYPSDISRIVSLPSHDGFYRNLPGHLRRKDKAARNQDADYLVHESRG